MFEACNVRLKWVQAHSNQTVIRKRRYTMRKGHRKGKGRKGGKRHSKRA